MYSKLNAIEDSVVVNNKINAGNPARVAFLKQYAENRNGTWIVTGDKINPELIQNQNFLAQFQDLSDMTFCGITEKFNISNNKLFLFPKSITGSFKISLFQKITKKDEIKIF